MMAKKKKLIEITFRMGPIKALIEGWDVLIMAVVVGLLLFTLNWGNSLPYDQTLLDRAFSGVAMATFVIYFVQAQKSAVELWLTVLGPMIYLNLVSEAGVRPYADSFVAVWCLIMLVYKLVLAPIFEAKPWKGWVKTQKVRLEKLDSWWREQRLQLQYKWEELRERMKRDKQSEQGDDRRK